MNKKYILLLLTFVIIFSSCESGNSEGSTSTTNTGEKYRTGTQGLLISFVPGVPPAKVFSDSEIGAIFEIKNKGSTDIDGAKLYLTGYDKKYLFGTSEQEQEFALGGKSPYNPNGELIELIDFNTKVQRLPDGIDKFTQTFKGSLCYPYETLASPSICINPDIHSAQATESVCTVKPITLSGGQGAPISIDKVEYDSIGSQLVLKIYISNHGKGIPYIKPIEDCHKSLRYNEVGLINIESVSFSDYDLTSNCKPNPVRLVNNKGFVVCTIESNDNFGSSSYVTPLNIKLSYNYRESIKKSFEIIQI